MQADNAGADENAAPEGDDAFGVGDSDSGMDDSTAPSPDATTPTPGEEANNMGENSPDEKRKKVKYFQEIEKILGVIEEFIDGVEEKSTSIPTTDTFTVKNLEYIKKTLYEYKEKTVEVLTKGITKLSYTDLIRLFFHIQNSINEIRKLYEFTMSQRKIEQD